MADCSGGNSAGVKGFRALLVKVLLNNLLEININKIYVTNDEVYSTRKILAEQNQHILEDVHPEEAFKYFNIIAVSYHPNAKGADKYLQEIKKIL